MSLDFTLPTILPSERRPVPAHKAVDKETAKKMAETAATVKDKGFSFWDLVDIINPLQHIPVVNTIYRELTGDQIGAVARIAGGAIFGGPIGAALGGVNAIAAQETGQDLGEMAMSKLGFDGGIKKDKTPDVQIANKEVPKNIPHIEVRPLAHHAPMPQIIWDEVPVQAKAVLPESKKLMALPEIDKQSAVDKAQIPSKMLEALQKYQELKSNS